MIPADIVNKITQLYDDNSKHSGYQNIPNFVGKEIGYSVSINEDWRGDTARYAFLKENIIFKDGERIADIGANIGFFTLSFAFDNPHTSYFAYEINENQTKFISLIKNTFNINNINVINEAAGIQELGFMPQFDTIFHLNVLHHAGVDFDSEFVENKNDFSKYAVQYLEKLKANCKRLIFQMGYNWGGNKLMPIVSPENVAYMFEYQIELFKQSRWKIASLGVYEKAIKKYHLINNSDINNMNFDKIVRDYCLDDNSEFYKRPIFILE